jgi:hypothetical protein
MRTFTAMLEWSAVAITLYAALSVAVPAQAFAPFV